MTENLGYYPRQPEQTSDVQRNLQDNPEHREFIKGFRELP